MHIMKQQDRHLGHSFYVAELYWCFTIWPNNFRYYLFICYNLDCLFFANIVEKIDEFLAMG